MLTFILVLSGIGIAVLIGVAKARTASFRAQSPAQYAGTTPGFDIRKVLSGPMDAEGMIFDLRGRMTSRFTARFQGHWDGAHGTLTEDFRYSTGNTQQRKWNITVHNDGRFTATADDIVGEAVGEQSGSTIRLSYRIVLPKAAGGHTLDVTDWMYLVDNGTVLNRSEFRKFGLRVGELFATFRQAA